MREGNLPPAHGGEFGIDIKKIGRKAVEEAEKAFIHETLQVTRWNRRKAARMMGVSYKALLYKIKRYSLSNRGDT